MPETSAVPRTTCTIDPPSGVSFAVGGWVVAVLASGLVVAVVHGSADPAPIWVLAVSLVAAWSVYTAAGVVASKRSGADDVVRDLGLRIRPIDALGVPIGVALQLAVVPALYVPLRSIWPVTFSEEALSKTADDLIARASAESTTVLLWVVIAIGAPLAEEYFFRGLLQRSLLKGYQSTHTWAVVGGVALAFALVHFRPIEYPGLFIAGLAFGLCAWRTDRLGMAVAAHLAFNTTALVFA